MKDEESRTLNQRSKLMMRSRRREKLNSNLNLRFYVNFLKKNMLKWKGPEKEVSPIGNNGALFSRDPYTYRVTWQKFNITNMTILFLFFSTSIFLSILIHDTKWVLTVYVKSVSCCYIDDILPNTKYLKICLNHLNTL